MTCPCADWCPANWSDGVEPCICAPHDRNPGPCLCPPVKKPVPDKSDAGRLLAYQAEHRRLLALVTGLTEQEIVDVGDVPPYPHARNDCDGCRERDADMTGRYPELQGRDLRWCQQCAGPALAGLVLSGYDVTLRGAS